jgi:hypothetical protein
LHYYSIIHLYCANFVIGLRAVKFLHTNKFEFEFEFELLLLLLLLFYNYYVLTYYYYYSYYHYCLTIIIIVSRLCCVCNWPCSC